MARPRKTAFGYLVGNCFGEVLIRSRKDAGLSQEELANDAGVDRSYVQLLEKGSSTPTLDVFLRLTRALKRKSGDVMNSTESLVVKRGAKRE
jgi:transcriptional regulator with XRE-family HTH domain